MACAECQSRTTKPSAPIATAVTATKSVHRRPKICKARPTRTNRGVLRLIAGAARPRRLPVARRRSFPEARRRYRVEAYRCRAGEARKNRTTEAPSHSTTASGSVNVRPSTLTKKSPAASPAIVRSRLRANLSAGARTPMASRTASATRSRTRSGVAAANAAEPASATEWRSSGTLTRITPQHLAAIRGAACHEGVDP